MAWLRCIYPWKYISLCCLVYLIDIYAYLTKLGNPYFDKNLILEQKWNRESNVDNCWQLLHGEFIFILKWGFLCITKFSKKKGLMHMAYWPDQWCIYIRTMAIFRFGPQCIKEETIIYVGKAGVFWRVPTLNFWYKNLFARFRVDYKQIINKIKCIVSGHNSHLFVTLGSHIIHKVQKGSNIHK